MIHCSFLEKHLVLSLCGPLFSFELSLTHHVPWLPVQPAELRRKDSPGPYSRLPEKSFQNRKMLIYLFKPQGKLRTWQTSKLRKANVLCLKLKGVGNFCKNGIKRRVIREPEVKYGDLINSSWVDLHNMVSVFHLIWIPWITNIPKFMLQFKMYFPKPYTNNLEYP